MEHLPLVAVIAGGLGVGLIAGTAIRIVPQHERAVRFRLGRVGAAPCGPGVILALPFVDRLDFVSLRTAALPARAASVRTADGHIVDAAVVIYYRIDDPIGYVTSTDDGASALVSLAEAAIRDQVGGTVFAAWSTDGDALHEHLRALLAAHASSWGMEVLLVELCALVTVTESQAPAANHVRHLGNGRSSTSTAKREHAAARP